MKILKEQFQLSPTDLVNFLGCKHLTELDRKVAQGKLEKPTWNNPAIAVLHKKGIAHEAEYLEYLSGKGLSIKNLSENYSTEATIEAMRNGYDVIYQAPLQKDKWFGIADFLVKTDQTSKLGEYGYEVQDTKLASETKAGTVIQLCMYTQIVGDIQERMPEVMHVVKPDAKEPFSYDSFRYMDFQSYFNLVKSQYEKVIESEPIVTCPIPVSPCEICRWWKDCNKKWHDDDHLSLVAGMRTSARKVIENENIKTLEAFAKQDHPLTGRPSTGSIETFEKLHGQAKVQLKGRELKSLIYELLAAESKRGLNRLPTPSPGDVYFDIEGDHFYKDGGIEYLFGTAYQEKDVIEYSGLWCESRKTEKEAFEQWINLILERWKQYPDMHIYHYGHYEPSAIKRLASRHATAETEVDDLLRNHLFVDLYATIKEALQASVESYSLKDLEQFTPYVRKADLWVASGARRSFSTALERNSINKLDKDILPLIEEYNKDDCLATKALHDWIEKIFQDAQGSGVSIERPTFAEENASEQVNKRDQAAKDLFESLTKDISPEKEERDQEEQAKWLLAHMVAYYRREERSNAWEFHYLNDQELDELYYERKAISYLKFDKDVSEEKNILHQYTFPNQEVSLKKGDSLKAILGDNIGSIHSIQKESLVIKKTTKSADTHPDAVIENNYIPTQGLESALHDLASEILKNGFDSKSSYKVSMELLLSKIPNFKTPISKSLRYPDEPLVDASIRLANDLDQSYLAIQGPPGTGKSFTGAKIIVELIRNKKRVGITAVSHSVVIELIKKVLKEAKKQKVKIDCVHKASKGEEIEGLTYQNDNGRAIKALDELKVVGGTAFLWARQAAIDSLDYLFIDEAGQMSLAYVLAIARSAKNVIMLGDPQQLEQPQKGSHPEGADVSALEHVLAGRKTVPDNKGLFLDTTWRLNPPICQFTSEVYYENRLSPIEHTMHQQLDSTTPFKGSGLFFVPVAHEGNKNRSSEEIDKVKEIVDGLLEAKSIWTDRNGKKHSLSEKDILIVAPYNSQVTALSEALPDISVGTVDKFQGREAPVVIYSMTSSSPEEAPRGMSFLYDPHRLNVATSRAQCICILVASDKLMQPECSTIDQMRWANGLCRYYELAQKIT